MKVYVMPADAYGCGHYRLIWPATALLEQGHDIIVIPPGQGSGFRAQTMDHPDGRQLLTGVSIPADADVIVIQRPSHPLQPQMIRLLRSHGKAVVVDMDDDMSNIHPSNAAYQEYNPRSNSPFSWRETVASCREATLVTTSTRTLQRIYAGHGRGVVIDNYVPAAYLEFAAGDGLDGVFGWGGTVKSHPNDLQVLGDAARRLVEAGRELRIVGDGRGIGAALRLRSEPYATGTVGLIDWARTLAATFGVGMVPLAATAFNTSKSRLKGIEMMAIGVPFVFSPREEYRRLHRESGAGLLAETPKQWYNQLDRLLRDEVLRKEQIEMGKTYMRDQTYQMQAWRWAEAWQRAYDIERGKT